MPTIDRLAHFTQLGCCVLFCFFAGSKAKSSCYFLFLRRRICFICHNSQLFLWGGFTIECPLHRAETLDVGNSVAAAPSPSEVELLSTENRVASASVALPRFLQPGLTGILTGLGLGYRKLPSGRTCSPQVHHPILLSCKPYIM